MGSCLSKKDSSSLVAAATVPIPVPAPVPVFVNSSTVTVDPKKCDSTHTYPKQEIKEEVKEEEEGLVKKEIFVIKHRKSHDKRAIPQQNEETVVNITETEKEKEKEEIGSNISNGVVRTSSCTKEEVDAILIQCGRLSRSNSSGKAASSARKYSGSKRSYDFDQNDGGFERDGGDDSGDVVKKKGSDDDEQNQRCHRQSSRQSPGARRRTPSRERDQQQSQQRSGSRERGSSSGSGRRVSRSPGRRSDNNSAATANASANANTSRPGKMVSVPATIALESATAANSTGVNRISVKRNAGEVNGAVGSRTAASPRSKSPARVNGNNVKEQQPSLSRSSSRKAEHSPCRRNPLGEIDPNSMRKTEHSPYRRNALSEIDPNSLQYPQPACNNKASNVNSNRIRNKSRDFEEEGVFVNDSSANVLNQASIQKPNAEIGAHGTSCMGSGRGALNSKVAGVDVKEKEHQKLLEEVKAQLPMTGNAVVTSVTESQKPQALTRTRSSRRSRDLDINPESLLNPSPLYTALLLEDIQNFHQKNTPSVSLPDCVTKACSILEAVADLNSTTSSNLSCAFSGERKTPSADQSNNKNAYNFSAGNHLVGKKMTEAKDPFVESEVFADNDLMEPSLHRYVTVRRGSGALGGVDMDGQESSGSNSFVGSSQQNWDFSASSWEPNSANSTDHWTSTSNPKEEDQSPLGFQRHALSEAAGSDVTKARKGFSGKRRDTDYQQNGNWCGRVVVASAAST